MDSASRTVALLGACAAAALLGILIGGPVGSGLFIGSSLAVPPLLLALRVSVGGRGGFGSSLGLGLLLEGSALLLLWPGTGTFAGLVVMALGFGLLPFLLVSILPTFAGPAPDDAEG